jgi:hypothetical protein
LAYLGNRPAESFASFEKQVFTIVNSQTAYTLSHSVTNENDIRLVVNNVVQEPGSGKAYTASGTTLTLSAALTNGTDTMYCVFLGRALQTVNPPNASVGSDQTAPTIITGQTAETSIATDDTILIHDTSASALRKMTRANFVSGIGGTNTPAWCVRKSANQSIATNTRTLITYDTEIFDTDSAFSSNTFTVPSGEGGKYFIFAYLRINSATNFENINSLIGVNGTMEMSAWGANDYYETLLIQGILDLSAGDTVNHYGRQDSGGNLNVGATDQGINTMFGGYKLIGV